MKSFPRHVRSLLTVVFVGSFLLAALPGCGRHAHKPASSLSEKDRATLDMYEAIRAALAVDDLRGTKRAATDLKKFLQPSDNTPATPLTGAVGEIADAAMLDKARAGFKNLSVNVVQMADGVEGYYIGDSPSPEGASWVQRSTRIENPYVGKPMRDLGTLRK